MEKELKILTATVSIQLITVDGKRMTKAVFNQVQYGYGYGYGLKEQFTPILGYVIDKGSKFLLFVNKEGELRKQKIDDHEKIAKYICRYNLDLFDKIDKSQYHPDFENIVAIKQSFAGDLNISSCSLENPSPANGYCFFEKQTLIDEWKQSHKNASLFLEKINNKQLYISI